MTVIALKHLWQELLCNDHWCCCIYVNGALNVAYSLFVKGVVVGNSGGKDSAVVIALCVKALGKENVLTVAMPCSSIPQDLEDAKLVADKREYVT